MKKEKRACLETAKKRPTPEDMDEAIRHTYEHRNSAEPVKQKRTTPGTSVTHHQPEPDTLFEYEKLTIHTNQPLQEIFDLLRNNQLTRTKIKFIKENTEVTYTGNQKCEEWERLEQGVIREDYREHKKYIEATEEEYGKRILWNKDPYLPRGWMDESRGNKTPKQKEIARALMKRLDKETRFIDVFNYIDSKVSPSGGEQTGHRYKQYRVDGKPRHPGILHVDRWFYTEAVRDLSAGQKDISLKNIQKYIQAFCDLGILVQLKKGGRGRKSMYAIGTWDEWRNNQYRLNRFLTKNRPGIDALLGFEAR